jgi:hypothetical protein
MSMLRQQQLPYQLPPIRPTEPLRGAREDHLDKSRHPRDHRLRPLHCLRVIDDANRRTWRMMKGNWKLFHEND